MGEEETVSAVCMHEILSLWWRKCHSTHESREFEKRQDKCRWAKNSGVRSGGKDLQKYERSKRRERNW